MVIIAADPRIGRRAEGGSYLLVLRLRGARSISVGSIGEVRFPAGLYIYTGSGMRGAEARARRHLRGEGKVHWHIDHLRRACEPVGALLVLSEERTECMLNELVGTLEGAEPFAPGFGCSDCGCATHLHLVDEGALLSLRRFFGTGAWLPAAPADKGHT